MKEAPSWMTETGLVIDISPGGNKWQTISVPGSVDFRRRKLPIDFYQGIEYDALKELIQWGKYTTAWCADSREYVKRTSCGKYAGYIHRDEFIVMKFEDE